MRLRASAAFAVHAALAITFVSLFSGAKGADLGLEQAAETLIPSGVEIWNQECSCGEKYVGPLSKRCPACMALKGGFTHGDPIQLPETAHTLRGEGFDASEDGTGRGTPLIPFAEPTYSISMRSRGDDGRGYARANQFAEDIVGCLDTVKPDAVAAPFDLRNITSPGNRSRVEFGDPSGTLHENPQCVALAFPWSNAATAGMPVDEIAPTMGASRCAEAAVAFQPKYFSGRPKQGGAPGAVCPTLTGNIADAGDNSPHVATMDDPPGLFPMPVMKVRRLMPIECERLQAWQDHHTRFGRREDGVVYELADSPRYKLCGNGVTASVSHFVGRALISCLKQDRVVRRKELTHAA